MGMRSIRLVGITSIVAAHGRQGGKMAKGPPTHAPRHDDRLLAAAAAAAAAARAVPAVAVAA